VALEEHFRDCGTCSQVAVNLEPAVSPTQAVPSALLPMDSEMPTDISSLGWTKG
jgi:hypothetical protein